MTNPPLPPKPRRLPKKGLLYTLIRLAGLLFKIGGWLLLAIGVIGFIFILVRAGPTFVGTFGHLDQQMGGLIFLISLVWLLAFPVVGLVGAAMVGIGLALGHVGTEPAEPTTQSPT